MVNVMVVEDQIMERQLLEIIVEGSDDYAMAYSIDSAAMAEVYCATSKVDLVLMDVLTAFGESGLEAAASIKAKYPWIKVIVMTSMPEFSFVSRAREAGVDSFWYKSDARAQLLDVMDRTMAGERVYPDSTPQLRIGQALSSNFTSRELEVLRELTSGDSDVEIAQRLNMSVWTVRSHIRHLMEKTGLESRTSLAVEGRKSGLVIRGY